MVTSEGHASPPLKEKHKKRKKDKRDAKDDDDKSRRHHHHHHHHKKRKKSKEAEREAPIPKAALEEVNGVVDGGEEGVAEERMKELEANQETEKLLRMRLEIKMKQYKKMVETKETSVDADGDTAAKDERRLKREKERREKREEERKEQERSGEKERSSSRDKESEARDVDDMFRDFIVQKMNLLEKEEEEEKEREDSPSEEKEKEKKKNKKEKKEKKEKKREDKENEEKTKKEKETEASSSGFGKFGSFKDLLVNYTDDSSSDSDISMTEIEAMLAGECSLDILDEKKKKKKKKKKKEEEEKKKKEKKKKKRKETRRSSSLDSSSSYSSTSPPRSQSPPPAKRKKRRDDDHDDNYDDEEGRRRRPREDERRRYGEERWSGDYRGGGGGGRGGRGGRRGYYYEDWYSYQRWGPPSSSRGGRKGRYDYERRSRSRSASRDDPRKPRSRPRSRSPQLKIDKAKLLEIARANALRAMQAGVLPPGVAIPNLTREEEASLKAGGKDLVQLTQFCKKISEKEKKAGDSDSDEDVGNRMRTDEEEESLNPNTGAAIHHPFALKNPTTTITLNIRNATQLPAKPHEERTIQSAEKLRQVFPVSSGNQHRQKELEWHEVTPEEKAKMEEDKKNLKKQMALMPWVKTPVPREERVFEEPEPDVKSMDIGSVVTERLNAMRKLQDNPLDVEALKTVQRAQDAMQSWAKSKEAPGLFTGSTGIVQRPENILPTGDPRNQAWVKKDMFKMAAPVQSEMGRRLLEKMGWKDGQALGKTNEGALEPLLLDIKTDRKGLMSQEEGPKKPQPVVAAAIAPAKDLSGKHPVSALMELASRKKWGPPQWELVEAGGPHHIRHFMFKVHVGGTWYQPTVASSTKKHAKSLAATVCLQAMGLLPRDAVVPDA